jgi:serine/threonine-protein kinase
MDVILGSETQYEIVRALGDGGMGAVYEARRADTGELVAVKILHGWLLAPGRASADRFRREAQAAALIDSPHVVRVLDAGRDEERNALYLVMERIPGEDLQRVIDRVGPLRPEAVLSIAGQTLAGLARAHEAGIIHRDIKPANLLLSPDQGGAITVKIVDFGLAKIRADAPGIADTVELTNTHDFFGSPLYMSPEQAESTRDVDHRTDIWSLGGTLYAALTGRAPHRHVAQLRWMIIAICTAPAQRLRARAPWVPAEVEELVHRAIEIDRARRFPSAAAMLEAVRGLAPEGFALREGMLSSAAPDGYASGQIAGGDVPTEAPRPLE